MDYTVSDGDRHYRALTPDRLSYSYGPEPNETFIASFERLREIGLWDVVLRTTSSGTRNPFRRMSGADQTGGGEPAAHPVVQEHAELDG